MSEHSGIDMISFTGSMQAGIDVAQRAAHTVKRGSSKLESFSTTQPSR